MDVKIENYDEYVKAFEEICSSLDALPVSESEIIETATEDIEDFVQSGAAGADITGHEITFPLEGIYCRDGRDCEFRFEVYLDEDGNAFARYVDAE